MSLLSLGGSAALACRAADGFAGHTTTYRRKDVPGSMDLDTGSSNVTLVLMKRKSRIILSAEEYFGSRAALAAHVRAAVNPWLQLIPGMFLYDAYQRSRERRIYSQHYLFPRKVAMEAALKLLNGAETEAVMAGAADEIRSWLAGKKIRSEEVSAKNMELVAVLVDHFTRLLNVEGYTHDELARAAYGDGDEYDEYVRRLARAETMVDAALLAAFGQNGALKKELMGKQAAREDLRTKDADAAFSR